MKRREFIKTSGLASAALGSSVLAAPAVHAGSTINWKMVTSWPKNFPGLGTGANFLAKLIGEKDFSTLFHQGAQDSMYLGKIAKGVVLVVLFNKSTTLGLVRLRVKRAMEELDTIIETLYEKLEYRNEEYDAIDESFTEQVEAEIDSLFAD